MPRIFVGTAGWSVARDAERFASEGTALERYASVFHSVEVNSSFYRRHRSTTWQRWHDAVPPHFRFTVKLPRTITHERQLEDPGEDLDLFFADIAPLAGKLGGVLVQLPPKLAFEADIVSRFLEAFRERSSAPVFIEPRHGSWADAAASSLLNQFAVQRVYADPQADDLRAAALTGGVRYLRLHGSPKVYYSAYTDRQIADYAALLRKAEGPCWCIFDNTASGAALGDAVKLMDLLAAPDTG